MYLVFSLDTFVLDLRLELSKMLNLAGFSVGDNFNTQYLQYYLQYLPPLLTEIGFLN